MAKLKVDIGARDSLSGVLRGLRGELGKLTTGFRRFGNSWTSLLAGVGVFQLGKGFIEANSQLEQFQFKLEAMLGSAQAGSQAFEFIKDFQKDLPLVDLQTTTDSFIQLVSAGIDPTTGALEGLITASAKFGLTSDDIKGVTRALRQTTAVTNAQKQELNQLAERIPKIQKLIADELGMTQDNFLKQMELRNLQANEVASATLRALEKTGRGVADRFSKTWQAGIARIKTAWFELLTEIGSAGLFDDFKRGLEGITVLLNKNRESIVAFANSVSQIFMDLGRDFVDIFDISDNDGFFKALAKTVAEIVGALRIGFIKLKDIGMNVVEVFRSAKVEVLAIKEQISQIPIIGSGVSSPLKDIEKAFGEFDKQLDKLEGKQFWADDAEFERVQKQIMAINDQILETNKLREDIIRRVGGSSIISKFIGTEAESQETKIALQEIQDQIASQLEKIDKLFKDAEMKRRERQKETTKKFKADTRELNESLSNLIDPFETQLELSSIEKFSMGWDEAMKDAKAKFKVTFNDMTSVGKFFAKEVTDAMSSGFESFFSKLIDGDIKRLKDVLLDFLKSIAQAINQQLSAQLAQGIVSQIGGFISGGGPNFSEVQTDTGGAIFNSRGGSIGTGQALAKAGPTKVEIVNQSGEPLRAKTAEIRQDPSGQIMSVVIDAVSRNKGNSRDILRGALA